MSCTNLVNYTDDLTNQISVQLWQRSYDESNIPTFTDMRGQIMAQIANGDLKNIEITANGVDETNIWLTFSRKDVIAKIESGNKYSSLRIEILYEQARGDPISSIEFREVNYSFDNSNDNIGVTFTISSVINRNGVNFYATNCKFSIEGVYIKQLEDEKITVGNQQNQSTNLNLPTNTLIQRKNLYGIKLGTTDRREDYSYKLINEVYSRYKNGKETATLLCEVGKYYDLEGNLVVDAESEDETISPLLKKYDIVIPYVMTANGEKPLSVDADGFAKQFEIIGVNISYNGIARQEIIIQEFSTI